MRDFKLNHESAFIPVSIERIDASTGPQDEPADYDNDIAFESPSHLLFQSMDSIEQEQWLIAFVIDLQLDFNVLHAEAKEVEQADHGGLIEHQQESVHLSNDLQRHVHNWVRRLRIARIRHVTLLIL